ncbi:MAG: VWA domain-containing protein [Desulfovibrio sp.]|jgi:Ca-activated chloride channel family protein|nr:VWA domain-containing protein [Desulfovibrio sp.]
MGSAPTRCPAFALTLLFALLVFCPGLFTPSAHAAGGKPDLEASLGYSVTALAPDVSVTVNVLVTIKAPDNPSREKRPPVAVCLVIDRSGSMSEARKMDYAKKAARTLVNSLDADDMLAVVTYETSVSIVSPLRKVTDKRELIRMIDAISPDGMTFLSGGLEAGVEQLKSVRREGPCRVILLSDGLANVGVTKPELVAAIGAKARNSGIGVSTIGLGMDFNEDLMQHLAQRGGGQYYYIEDSEYLPAVFKQELALVLDSFTRDLRVSFTPTAGVGNVKIYGYSSKSRDRTVDIETSDVSSGENRQIMLQLTVTPDKKSGAQELGVLELSYVSQGDGAAHTVSIPAQIAVLADENARREAEERDAAQLRVVREEAMLLEAEEAQVAAVDELSRGNTENARKILLEQEKYLATAAPMSKPAASKLAQIKDVSANLDKARNDAALQNAMMKKSKASAYMSAKGQKQGILLRPGDSGFMVEKLQNSLKAQGVYSGKADGVYSEEVEKAVRAFQRSKSLTEDGIAGAETLMALGL